jgi:hypothetical protein
MLDTELLSKEIERLTLEIEGNNVTIEELHRRIIELKECKSTRVKLHYLSFWKNPVDYILFASFFFAAGLVLGRLN